MNEFLQCTKFLCTLFLPTHGTFQQGVFKGDFHRFHRKERKSMVDEILRETKEERRGWSVYRNSLRTTLYLFFL